MTNFELYRLLNLIINKDVYANAMSPDEFDLQLKAKSIHLFSAKLPDERSVSTGQAGGSRMLQHDLSPFLIDGDFTVASGLAAVQGLKYCENFYSASSLTSEIISAGEVAGRLKSYIKAPSADHLAATVSLTGLRVYGMDSGSVHVIGYRYPAEPAFAVTTDEATLEMTYDTVNSVELEWSDTSKLDILHLILQDMGVTVERQEVTQLANKLLTTGK